MKEIRKDVREYILKQVNKSLARLGVSEDVVEKNEFEDKYNDLLRYQFESKAIRQFPMMFEKVIVKGDMIALNLKPEHECYREGYDVIQVSLDYSYELFKRGSNGCEIGTMMFWVAQELPATFKDKFSSEEQVAELFIRRIKGIEI